jgi:hypothetical protein
MKLSTFSNKLPQAVKVSETTLGLSSADKRR